MAKGKDWNDKSKEDKEKAKKEFEESEEDSNIVDFMRVLEDKNPDLVALRELNNKHIFINSISGSSYVTNLIYNEVTEKEEIEFIGVESFKNIYLNKFVPGYKIPVTQGKWWLAHELRNTVEGITFCPAKNDKILDISGKKYLNLWEGFGVVSTKGSWRHTARHVYRILCNSDKQKFKYVIRWLAWAVQNPDKPAEVCMAFKGEQGAGKGFLFSQFKRIFGKHGMTISDRSRLTGKFTGHFRTLSFLFCDEVYYPGDKEIEGRIKSIVTEKYIDIEEKYKGATTINNILHIVMCTNKDWFIPATRDERRYFVEEVNNKYAKNNISDAQREIYFNKLWEEMNNGGREAMLHDLLKIDLNNWHPRNHVPQTKALQKQKEMSLNYLQQAVKQVLEDGVFPGSYDGALYVVPAETFYNFLDKIDHLCARFSSIRKSEVIRSLGCNKGRIPGIGRIQWEFPDLLEMRANWDKLYGRNNWDSETKWSLTKLDI